MIEFIYLGCFWFFAVLYILVKSIKSNEIKLNFGILAKLSQYSTIVKIFPVGLAILFTLSVGHESIYLSLVLSIGLFFCMLGDLGMEKGLIPGLPIFLIAQIIFLVTFAGQALEIGITTDSLLLSGIVAVGTIVYILFFLRYLESSDKGLGKFRTPVLIYCVFISLMLTSTVLLWTTSSVAEFGVVVFGALLFVISDSIIAVHEFHHDISYREIKVMSTYYAAIFLLSLSSLTILI
ncbi:MAG: lysoplasmalogenase [Candidatus Hodarchaeales archaeon]